MISPREMISLTQRAQRKNTRTSLYSCAACALHNSGVTILQTPFSRAIRTPWVWGALWDLQGKHPGSARYRSRAGRRSQLLERWRRPGENVWRLTGWHIPCWEKGSGFPMEMREKEPLIMVCWIWGHSGYFPAHLEKLEWLPGLDYCL